MGTNIDQNSKVNELTIGELKTIISDIVREAIEDILEDREALLSKNYINSIKEAREEYKSGQYKNLKDI